MNKFVYRTLCKNYEASAIAIVKEMRTLKHDLARVTAEALGNYRDALNMLRCFLDSEGLVMPPAKWKYDNQDESTWLYTPQRQLNKSFMMLQSRRR
jgi:hypothetical protein